MKSKFLLYAVVLFVASRLSAITIENFEYTSGIETEEQSPLYAVDLPERVYSRLKNPDLHDLRVFNHEKDVIPHSLDLVRFREYQTTVSKNLSFFPVYSESIAGDINSSVTITKDGKISITSSTKSSRAEKISSYLVDLKNEKNRIEKLDFDWHDDGKNRLIHVAIAESDDLNSWNLLVSEATLGKFVFAGETLEQKSVDLSTLHSRYLRISWTKSASFQLKQLTGVFSNASKIQSPLNWSNGKFESTENKDHLFSTHMASKDRVKVSLPEQNSIYRYRLFSRASLSEQWKLRSEGMLFRILLGEKEIMSPPLSFAPVTDHLWKFTYIGKDVSKLEKTPQLSFGWVAHKLYFLAKGSPPFTLAYASAKIEAADFGFSSMTDSLGTDQSELSPKHAKLSEEKVNTHVEEIKPVSKSENWDIKKVLLWIAIFSFVLLTVGMLFKLLKEMNSGKEKK